MKIYASEAGFLYGELVYTTYPSGCLRHIAWTAHNRDLRPDINPAFIKVGAVMEMNHEKTLQGREYQREVPLTYTTASGVEIRGRCDVLLPGLIQETKATFSKSGIQSVFNKGEYKLTYLAQLVGYMAIAEVGRGEMIHGAFEFNQKDIFTGTEFRQVGTKVFQVHVDSGGDAYVDGRRSHTLRSRLDHMESSGRAVDNRRVWPVRPYNATAKYGSPCHFCTLRPVCDKVDSGQLSHKDSFTAVRHYLGEKDE